MFKDGKYGVLYMVKYGLIKYKTLTVILVNLIYILLISYLLTLMRYNFHLFHTACVISKMHFSKATDL